MNITLPINWKILVFLVLLEVLTIPFIAISNTIVIKSPLYMGIIGFIVAFAALILILKMIELPIRRYFSKLTKLNITKVSGIFYLGLISGFLLMLMFYVQELTYKFTSSGYIVGTTSGLVSVSVSLIIYSIIQKFFNYGIKITAPKKRYILTIATKDIIIITLLFTVYETLASPLSIIWLSHYDHRFVWGIISGVAAGLGGGLPLLIICYITKYKITIGLKKIP